MHFTCKIPFSAVFFRLFFTKLFQLIDILLRNVEIPLRRRLYSFDTLFVRSIIALPDEEYLFTIAVSLGYVGYEIGETFEDGKPSLASIYFYFDFLLLQLLLELLLYIFCHNIFIFLLIH